MREFHSIVFKVLQPGEKHIEWARMSEGEGANRKKKVENIGNSYFPALAGPAFCSSGRGYSRREYLTRVRKYEETRPGNRRALLIR